MSDAPFSFEIRLLQQILSAGKDIRRQANLCVLSLKNIELFQIQHGKDSSKCKQVAARLRSPARQTGPAKSAARQAGSTEKHTKKVSSLIYYAINIKVNRIIFSFDKPYLSVPNLVKKLINE